MLDSHRARPKPTPAQTQERPADVSHVLVSTDRIQHRVGELARQISRDYLGFDIPDVWVVGYGLDYADHYRTLPHIAELRKVPGAR